MCVVQSSLFFPWTRVAFWVPQLQERGGYGSLLSGFKWIPGKKCTAHTETAKFAQLVAQSNTW